MSTDPHHPAAPGARRPSTNPFAGVPVADYVTDGVAAVLLFTSLALPWDYAHHASDRVEVVLITILSVLSLSLPYLSRAGVFPGTWTVLTTRGVRLLANAPYAVLVLVYLVIDGVAAGSSTTGGLRGGVGTGAALGLAGAVLGAQPRRSELGPVQQDRAVPGQWLAVVAALTTLTALTDVISAVVFLAGVGRYAFGVLPLFATLVPVLAVLVLVWPLLGTVRRNAADRRVAVAVGTVLTVLFVVGSSQTSAITHLQSLHYPGFGLVLIPAAAAAAAAPATSRAVHSSASLPSWVAAAASAWLVMAGLAAVLALGTVLVVTAGTHTASIIVALLLVLLLGVAAVVGRALGRRDAPEGLPLMAGTAGVAVVLGLVYLIVLSASEQARVSDTDLLLALGLPVTVLLFLLVPAPVRQVTADGWRRRAAAGASASSASAYEWPSAAPAAPAERFTAAPVAIPRPVALPGAVEHPGTVEHPKPVAQREPVVEHRPDPPAGATGMSAAAAAPDRPPAPSEQSGYTPAQAANPGTDPALLAAIAEHAPALRPFVAANPATYPGLLDWLAQLGDPQVDAALRARRPAR